MHACCVCLVETPYYVCAACQTSSTPWPPAGLERCRRWLYCPHRVYIGQRCEECPSGRSEGFQDAPEDDLGYSDLNADSDDPGAF